MRVLRRALPFVLLTALTLAQPRETGSRWIRLRATHLEILTDAGERSARQALDRLEQIRQVIPAGESRGPLDLRVFLFASDREYRSYAPNSSASGFYQSGLERDYIVANASASLDRVIVHEYVHFVLNEKGASLPQWLQEGTAEFYSNIDISRSRLRVGAPIEAHRALLARGAWLDAAALRFPPANAQGGALYYAQSWALVHMLNLDPAYRDGMARFAQLLSGEATSVQDDADVFRQAFGRGFEQALIDLRAYVPRLRATDVQPPPALFVAPASNAPPERLTAVDALLLRAELAFRLGHSTLAAELYRQGARDDPNSSAAAAGLGALALAQSRAEEARAHLERAVRLDPRNAAAWFESAMLEQDAGAGAARVRELLEKTVAANPNFGEAHALLGIRATDDGRYEAAVAHLQQAARLLPRKSYVWHALAFAQEKTGDIPAAAQSARRAVRTAMTPEQAAMAEALLQRVTVP